MKNLKKIKDSGGGLISFGLNNQGQLGFPNTGTEKSSNYCPFPHVDFPTRISFTFGNKITSFATGADHAVAVDENGKVFAFGHNYDGQIGDGTWKDKFFFNYSTNFRQISDKKKQKQGFFQLK